MVVARAIFGTLAGASPVAEPVRDVSRGLKIRTMGADDDIGRAPAVEPFGVPDEELVRRIVAGDQGAFEAAYERHARALYGAVVRLLADAQAAEEVVQDVFVALWNHAARFDGARGSLAGWLFTFARNRALDHLRRTSRRPVELASMPGPQDDQGSDERFQQLIASGQPIGDGSVSEDPETAAARAWTRAVVRSLLDAMPPLERRAIELAYDHGLTQNEIALHLGWPIGTVKTRTRRGLLRLREVLEGSALLEGSPEAQRGSP